MITGMQERWFPLRQSEYSLNFFQMVSCTCPLHMREGLTPHVLLQPNHVFSWQPIFYFPTKELGSCVIWF